MISTTIESSSPTLPLANPGILPDTHTNTTDTDTEYERQSLGIPFFSKRRCVIAFYCLACTGYIIAETRRAISAADAGSTRGSQAHIVTITVPPSPLPTSSSGDVGGDGDNGKRTDPASFESMPASFGRPLKGNDIEAHLITIDIDHDEDSDDKLCPIEDPFVDGGGRVTKDSNINIWGNTDNDAADSVGTTGISQGSKDYDSNDMCISDKPVALLASRGKCPFQAKAIEALHQKGHQNCRNAVSFLIIYDNRTEEQYLHHDQEDDNNHGDRSSPPLLRMGATNSDAKKLMKDMPISLLFVSYDTGMALKQAIRDNDDGSGNSADHGGENGLMVTLNPGESQHRHRKYALKNNYYYNADRTNVTNNNNKPGGHNGNHVRDDFPPAEDPTKVLFVQMVTAMSLMFTFFVCIGCIMVCFCGHPDMEENGWFTIHMDRNGFVFGRPDNSNGEGAVRLLTEEEVFGLQEVEFGDMKDNDSCDHCYNCNNDDLEGGEATSMEVDNSASAAKHTKNQSYSSDMQLLQRNVDTEPLQDQSSSLYNHDSLSWNAMCSICLEDYEQGEKLRMLPCHHMFHTECIVPWLTERFPNCPLCKAQVIAGQVNQSNDNLNDDNLEMVNTVGDHEEDEEVAMEQEERAIETNSEQSLAVSWRNFFLGSSHQNPTAAVIHQNQEGVLDALSSEEDQTMSNLSTPLLQDSTSPVMREIT